LYVPGQNAHDFVGLDSRFSRAWRGIVSAGMAGTSCKGPAAVTNVSYVITSPAGKTATVTKLAGNVTLGDTVEAVFTVPAKCAPEQLSLASYQSFLPPSDPAFVRDQVLFSSASSTFSAGQHTLTAQIVPAPKPASTVTITGSMEGNLPVHPGDTLRAGYDFTIPGTHPAATVRVFDASVSLTVDCPGGSTVPVTIPLPAQFYTIPANSPDWFPSGDQQSPLVYQGSVTVPTTLCAGQTGHAPQGATFTAKFQSTDPQNRINVRFHYADNTAGSWSGTASTTPSGAGHFQIDFATGPVRVPPRYGGGVLIAGAKG
jgi:hypothetical protein